MPQTLNMSSILSTNSGLPSYRASTRHPSSPTESKRESVYAIISSYRLPPSPRSPVAPFGTLLYSTTSLCNSQSSPSKSRRAPPPPALRLFPRDSTLGTAKAVHHPPHPWKTKDEKRVKCEWTAPVGGEEEEAIVVDEGKGKGDVFLAIYKMERGAVKAKGVHPSHQEWNPVVDGPRLA